MPVQPQRRADTVTTLLRVIATGAYLDIKAPGVAEAYDDDPKAFQNLGNFRANPGPMRLGVDVIAADANGGITKGTEFELHKNTRSSSLQFNSAGAARSLNMLDTAFKNAGQVPDGDVWNIHGFRFELLDANDDIIPEPDPDIIRAVSYRLRMQGSINSNPLYLGALNAWIERQTRIDKTERPGGTTPEGTEQVKFWGNGAPGLHAPIALAGGEKLEMIGRFELAVPNSTYQANELVALAWYADGVFYSPAHA